MPGRKSDSLPSGSLAILKQAELGIPVAERIPKVGVSEQTDLLSMEKETQRLEADPVRELKQLRRENIPQKRTVADLIRDKAMLQDMLSKKF